jgi:hypothetical protein
VANEARITALKQEYDDISEEFKTIWRLLDQYKESGQRNKGILKFYQTLVDYNWKRFNIVVNKLLDIDDNEPEDLLDVYLDLTVRLTRLDNIDSSSMDVSNAVANPKLSECNSNTSSSYQRRKNNPNNSSNNDHTPPMENVVSNLAPIPSHDTRSSLHDTRSAPARDLATARLAS